MRMWTKSPPTLVVVGVAMLLLAAGGSAPRNGNEEVAANPQATDRPGEIQPIKRCLRGRVFESNQTATWPAGPMRGQATVTITSTSSGSQLAEVETTKGGFFCADVVIERQVTVVARQYWPRGRWCTTDTMQFELSGVGTCSESDCHCDCTDVGDLIAACVAD